MSRLKVRRLALACTLSVLALAAASPGLALDGLKLRAPLTASGGVTSSEAVGEDCVKQVDLTKLIQDLSSCNLRGVTINEVTNPDDPRGEPYMFNWKLTGATLSGATFNVKWNSMIGVDLVGANLSRATVTGLAGLAYSDFTGVTARRINLTGYGTLQNSVATGAIFDGANLVGPYSMAYVDLTGASLRKATVSGDESLWGANLTDADLSGALITGTNALTDAIFSNTVCPDRTNSDDSGGTCVGHGLAGSSAP